MYLVLTFMVGLVLSVPTAWWINADVLGSRGAALTTLCWNVLFVMILPLVLDWSERRHCKVRFLELEEVAKTSPELAAAIAEQCRQLEIAHLKLAVADTAVSETVSYGLWGQNPRLIVSDAILQSPEKSMILPSIEAELSRFTRQDHTLIYLMFSIVQILLQQVIVAAV